MHIEQFYLGCLAHASYMLSSQGEAVVVDPQRDVEIYLEAARRDGLKIRHIFETHLHADFVSGHRELAERTGAAIYIGARAGARFPHQPVSDGYELRFGQGRITVLETPGHTPESICLVVSDDAVSPRPSAVLTGDTLFIGDVGRPDLSPEHTPQELAGLLYDSLHGKLMKLADDVVVYPAHGAGSLCGRNMRADKSSTIGTERLTNYALQITSRDEFIRQLTTNLPARPGYFVKDAEINREGAPALAELGELQALPPAEVKEMLSHGGVVLDVRSGDEFAAGHLPGSLSIPLSGQFASWAGSLLGLYSEPVLVAASAEQLAEARMRLARVGIEQIRGSLAGGIAGWTAADFDLQSLPQLTVNELAGRRPELAVLDVRREGEWNAGHLDAATWFALDHFPSHVPDLPRDRPLAVHCKSGYRSLIACSFLQRAGFRHVINVIGGFDAWHGAGLPVVKEQPVSA